MSCTMSITATGGFRRVAIAGCGLAALIAGKSLGQSLEYELRNIGTLGGDDSVALAMNDLGMVVGWAETAPPECQGHAFVWHNGVMTDLGTLGGTWSEARSINTQGEIVGVSEMPDGSTHAFYAVNGRMFDLNLVLDPSYGVDFDQAVTTESGDGCFAPFTEFIDAAAINDNGSIIGCGYLLGKPSVHGYILHPAGGFGSGRMPMFDYWPLGELPDAGSCIPGDINYIDQVVGLSGYQAFIWDGAMHYLDMLSTPSPMKSKANAINNDGTVVGFTDAGAKRTAAMWRLMRRINLGYRGWFTEALDINNLDQVVGRAEGEAAVAILWDGKRAVDLNEITAVPISAPGYEPDNFHWASLREATAINDSGMIAGYGTGIDDRSRAFLLLPLGTPAGVK